MTDKAMRDNAAPTFSRGLAPEDIQHLEMIQSVISRMASNSFLIKGWAATLVAAILVVAVERDSPTVALLSTVPVALFWALDAYYLWQERLFRSLYDTVRRNPVDIAAEMGPFSMATRRRADGVSMRRTLLAATIAWFHGSLLLLSAGVLGVLWCAG